MTTFWYLLLGCMLIAFAILDGLNLGSGAMHLFLGRSNDERRTHFAAIGPVWWGYEVWLLAAGGSMVSAFPVLYAKSFSGFYLVLNVVLWLLIIRGTSIEFRQQVENDLWHGFWDVWYCLSSALLAVLFGAAVGNVIRGVPMGPNFDFTGSFALALNPYAILVGVLSLVYLCMHGSLFIAEKTSLEEHRARALRSANVLYIAAVVLAVLTTAATFTVRRDMAANFTHFPALALLPLITIGGLIGIGVSMKGRKPGNALLCSAVALAGLMGSAGASLYPNLLPNLSPGGLSLTVHNASAPSNDLVLSAALNVIGLIAVAIYGAYVHKVFRGPVKVSAFEEGHAY